MYNYQGGLVSWNMCDSKEQAVRLLDDAVFIMNTLDFGDQDKSRGQLFDIFSDAAERVEVVLLWLRTRPSGQVL